MDSVSSLTYAQVASDIIKKSINSIAFIDDELAEPFSDATESEIALSKGIYDSFKNHNCTVDFIKYNTQESSQNKYNFSPHDMLVLDWQLTKAIPEYSPTLKIINNAINQPNLHFVCIYTSTEKAGFPNIIYQINSYFSNLKTKNLDDDFNAIETILDENGYNIKDVFDDQVQSHLKSMVLNRKKAGAIFSDIKKRITQNSNQKVFNQLQQHFIHRVKEKAYPDLLYGFCGFGIRLNEDLVGEFEREYPFGIVNYVDEHYFTVNHTIVLITNKDEVAPEKLYAKFKSALINGSGNFLTMMGLEMRNLFKECSSFIGKDIDAINELAFFHHRDTSVPAEAFYDFLKELWKGQASSFLYNNSNQPKIFETLDSYKKDRGIEEKMKTFISDKNAYEQHLGKLNFYYNILNAIRKENDKMKFGDIFRIYDSEEKPTERYLLCITAHCDCLYAAEKINNMFFFVKGSKGNLEKALREGDTAFDSYLSNNQVIEVVNWFDKPFTVHVKTENNNISKSIPIVIGDDVKILKYHSTLKENYAQRIANNAFIYPFHVGIFFADTKHS